MELNFIRTARIVMSSDILVKFVFRINNVQFGRGREKLNIVNTVFFIIDGPPACLLFDLFDRGENAIYKLG